MREGGETEFPEGGKMAAERPGADAAGGASAPGREVSAPAKASTLNRAIAKSIDILIALLLAELPGHIGFFAGLTYIGAADGFMGGRSVGKRLIGLRVMRADGTRVGNFRDSLLRNSTFGLLYGLYFIPFLGWIIAAAGLALELLLVIGNPRGMRLGDEIAGTVVADETRGDAVKEGPTSHPKGTRSDPA